MLIKTCQKIRLKCLSYVRLICLTGVIVFVDFQLHEVSAQELVLQDMTFTAKETYSADNSITVGPDVTISNSGDLILGAPTVSLSGAIYIVKGGKLTVISHAIPVNVKNGHSTIPKEFILSQNYPNPFNPETIIEYSIPEYSVIDLSIYDVSGRKIKTLIHTKQNPGFHQIKWDGRDEAGQEVPNGIYFYHFRTDSFSDIRRMIFIK